MGFNLGTNAAGQPLNTIYAQLVNQVAQVLMGQLDAGALSLLQPVAAPASAPTVTPSAGGITGTGYQWGVYWITGIPDGTGNVNVTGRTTPSAYSAAQALAAQEATVSISALTVPTGVVGWGAVRNKSDGSTWYEVPGAEQFVSIAGVLPQTFVDDVADASLVTAAPSTNTTGTSLNGGGGAKGVEVAITTANTWQTVAAFTPTATGLFRVQAYAEVPTGGANLGVQVTYADAAGAETLSILPGQSQAAGPWSSLSALIAAHSGTPINVQVQSSSTSTVASAHIEAL